MLPRPILAVVLDPASQDEFPAVTKIPNIAQAFLSFAEKFRCRSLPFFCSLSKLQWPAKKGNTPVAEGPANGWGSKVNLSKGVLR
jgi:hypothetical protein